MKVGRHHADDGVGAPVESQRPAERRGIPSHLAPPEPVGEHRDARSSSDVLVCEWRPPDDRPRAKSGVEAGAHARDANLRRRPASGERLLLGPDPCSLQTPEARHDLPFFFGPSHQHGHAWQRETLAVGQCGGAQRPHDRG